MLTPEERQDRIAGIRELPARVEAAVDGLSEEQLSMPEREGEWSVRQVVHHLADAHMNLLIRMKLIITEVRPTLKSYNQERFAQLPDTTQEQLQPSLSILQGVHRRSCVLLETLSDSVWERSGQHPERGEMTLEDVLIAYSNHCENHLRQIVRLRASKGW